MLEAFLSLDNSLAKALPTVIIFRMVYSITILIKIELLVLDDWQKFGYKHDFGRGEVYRYLDRLLIRFEELQADNNSHWISSVLLLPVVKLRTWMYTRRKLVVASDELEPLQPLMHLYLGIKEETEQQMNRELCFKADVACEQVQVQPPVATVEKIQYDQELLSDLNDVSFDSLYFN